MATARPRLRRRSTARPAAGLLVVAPPFGTDEPWLATPTAQPEPQPAPRSRRPPSFMGLIGASAALVVAGVLLALGAAGAFDLSAQAVFAAELLAGGLVLVAGTWFCRSSGLIGLGDVQSSYHLGVGNETLDLSGVDWAGTTRHIYATVGVGNLDVIVPPTTRVVVRGRVGAGEVELFDKRFRGTQVDRSTTVAAGGTTRSELDLDVRVGIGQVTVARGAQS